MSPQEQQLLQDSAWTVVQMIRVVQWQLFGLDVPNLENVVHNVAIGDKALATASELLPDHLLALSKARAAAKLPALPARTPEGRQCATAHETALWLWREFGLIISEAEVVAENEEEGWNLMRDRLQVFDFDGDQIQAEIRAEWSHLEEAVGDEWSEVRSPSEWERLFEVSKSTLKRRIDNGIIRVKKVTSKSWIVHRDDIPK